MSAIKLAYYTNYTGCSRWASPMRGYAVHIASIGKNPICGKTYQNGASDRPTLNIDEVTCAKCKRVYEKTHKI